MKTLTRTLTLATLAAGVALSSLAVSAQDAPPPRDRGAMAGMHKAMLDQYDTNKDGKLDEAERAAMRADRFKRLDGNGDGKITKAEFPQALEAEAEAQKARRAEMMFDAMDANKDGTVTAEEFAAFKPDHERGQRGDRGDRRKPQ